MSEVLNVIDVNNKMYQRLCKTLVEYCSLVQWCN